MPEPAMSRDLATAPTEVAATPSPTGLSATAPTPAPEPGRGTDPATTSPGSTAAATLGRDLSGASISILTAVVVLLTALDGAFLLENQLFPVIAAAAVSLGAATGIFRLRNRGFRNPGRWLSALGGAALLGGGLCHTFSQVSGVGVVGQAVLLTSTLVAPAAALLSFLGGVLQLPARGAAATFTAVSGAGLCTWFALGPTPSPLLCAIGAAATVAGVVLGLVLARQHTAELIPREVLRQLWSVLVGSAVACTLVSCLLFATILPDTGATLRLTPAETVWGFFAVTVLLAVAALRQGRSTGFTAAA